MKTVSSVGEIEELCKVRRVEFYEVASRVDSAFASVAPEDEQAGEVAEDLITKKSRHKKEGVHWTIGFNLTKTSLVVRARVVALRGDRRHVVDAGVVYDITEPFEAPHSTMLDFVGERCFPTLYPHVQAAVNDGAAKLDKRADLLDYSYPSEMAKTLKSVRVSDDIIAPHRWPIYEDAPACQCSH